MNQHPDQPDEEGGDVLENFSDVHFHTNGGHQNVDENTAEFAGTRALVTFQSGKGKNQTDGCGKNNEPEESARDPLQFIGFQKIGMLRKKGRNKIGSEVRQPRAAKSDRQNNKDVGHARIARHAGLVTFHPFAEFVHRRAVGLEPAVHPFAHTRPEKQKRHPDIGHDHVDDDHTRKQRI